MVDAVRAEDFLDGVCAAGRGGAEGRVGDRQGGGVVGERADSVGGGGGRRRGEWHGRLSHLGRFSWRVESSGDRMTSACPPCHQSGVFRKLGLTT